MINEDIKNEIKRYLGQYLEETGRSTKKLFNCLNLYREDRLITIFFLFTLKNVK
jgi:hypothetical protein